MKRYHRPYSSGGPISLKNQEFMKIASRRWCTKLNEFEYAGEIFKIGLTNRNISKLATARYYDRFLGGRDITAKVVTCCWEALPESNIFFLYYGGKKQLELLDREILSLWRKSNY